MKIAFVFPGQGSQSVGMFDAWSDNVAATETIRKAGLALDQDLADLMHQGPSQALDLTTNTQPVMLAAAVAMYNAWIDAGGKAPAVVAGHSLGEYSALVASGALDLQDAVRLVRVRADAMQDAVPVGTGAMAAILGLDDATVQQVCAEAAGDQVVEAVNFNAPAQVVIAGHVAAVERACEQAKEKGARRAVMLPVSAPFHSSLLRPAADVLEQALADVVMHPPCITLINNVDVACPDQPDTIKNALIRQAWHPVRWVGIIERMKRDGVTHIVECGPGKVLSSLTRRIDRDSVSLSITDPASMQAVLKNLQG